MFSSKLRFAILILASTGFAHRGDANPLSAAAFQNISRDQLSASYAQANPITLPSGTAITVRMIDDVDSSRSKVGDAFHASLESPLVVGNTIVANKGADVFGSLVRVDKSGKIAGAGRLRLALTGIQIDGQLVPISTATYEVVGKGRGKQSAERIGGGAAAGATIGGIAGGGVGAAIGAGAGAAGGTLVQLLTHGDRLRIPSESLLEFTLEQAVDIPAVTAVPGVTPTAAQDATALAPSVEPNTVESASKTATTATEPADSTEPVSEAAQPQTGDGLVFVPLFARGSKIFAPGFSAQGAFSMGDDRVVLDAGGTAEFAFTVPAGETLTVAFGTPIGGLVNTVSTEISLNGVAIATLPGVANGLGVKSPVRTLVWRRPFGPGSYVLSFRSGGWGINFYGLWLSRPEFAGSAPPRASTPPAKQRGQVEARGNLIEDNFTSDTALDSSQWQTNTPLLAAIAQSEESSLIDPQLSFDAAGMKMSGVSGTYQFTGIQSTASMSPPFTARVTVKGSVAHGDAFGIYIDNGDSSQGVRLEGNLNPENGGYRGLWISHAKAAGERILEPTELNQWYTFVVSVDGNGIGTVTILNPRGGVLASRAGWHLGMGPFSLVLGQREGAPFTVGPNEAVWASAEALNDNAQSQTLTETQIPDPLGTRWDENQAGSSAIWTRRGTSNVFDANWENGVVTAVVTVWVQGSNLRMERRNSSDGNDCDYKGSFAPDWATASGTFDCLRWVHGGHWSAKIERALPLKQSASTRNSGIRSFDFQNRDYPASCLVENGTAGSVHISNGEGNTPGADFRAEKAKFGDLKGDGQEEAVVVFSCHPSEMSPNVVDSRVFVFEMSATGPRILAMLPSSNWTGRRVEDATVSDKSLVVSYLDGECHACTDWIVAVRFSWNGTQFVRVGQTRKPYKPS